jgi:hypothetical protein
MIISPRSPKRSTERSAGSENAFRRFAKRWRLLVAFLPFCIVLLTAKTLLSDSGTLREVFTQSKTVPVQSEPVLPSPTPTVPACSYYVTAEVLHVRSCPDTLCGLVEPEYLSRGERVLIVRHSGAWGELDGGGWVNESFVKQECE